MSIVIADVLLFKKNKVGKKTEIKLRKSLIKQDRWIASYNFL